MLLAVLRCTWELFGCGVCRLQFVGALSLKLLQESASSVEIGVGRGYAGTAMIDVVPGSESERASERDGVG